VDHYIKLSVSSSFFDNEPNPSVSDANVTLSDVESSILLEELNDSVGVYFIPKYYRSVLGKAYTLNI